MAATTAAPAAKVRIPKDAPDCVPAGTRAVFVAPMGEPFRAAPGQVYPSATWFAAADRDGDGTIDRAEFAADAARFFARLDRDGDGRLLPEEVAAYERDIAPEIAIWRPMAYRIDPRARRRGRPEAYGGPTGAGLYSWLNVPQPVSAADADFDRAVTAAEFRDAAMRRFDLLDRNREGRLRRDLLGPTPQQRALEGPCRPPPPPKSR